jgi:hypothetical protein
MVTGARQPQERRTGARFAGDHGHCEDVGIEAYRPLQVGHEQDGVVEPDRVDRHHGLPVGPTSFQPLCHGQPLVALRVMLRNAISSRVRAIRSRPASTTR